MVFRPTMEEFSDFSRYIQYMESQGAHRGGVAKVIPPKEWSPCKSYDNIDDLTIPAPISQVVTGQKGLYTQYNIQQKPLTVKELRRLTNTDKYSPPFHESYEDLERTYWKNITFNPAIYGADISGSLYDKNVDVWNVARLDTILDLVENDTGVKIEGVNTAYLYFGMWKTSFAWHTEDMDLYSINYVHFGAPKTWYAIPPEHGKRLERLASGFFPNSYSTCPAFLRHKMTLISPSVLKRYGIPFDKITQEAGEFMITFPYGYHSGFNHGFNCAESTNFASERWIDYGIAAEKCRCQKDMVYINMDLFIINFQPEKYELWKNKKYEVKLSYQDIPVLPDFSKKPIHWRKRMKEIKQENDKQKKLKSAPSTPVKISPSPSKKTPQKSNIKSPAKMKSIPSPDYGKVEINEEQRNISKMPCFVKLEKDFTICHNQHVTSPSKKSPIKRSLSETASTTNAGVCLQNFPQTCSQHGSSGCLNNTSKSAGSSVFQLKMGSVFSGFIPTTNQDLTLEFNSTSLSSQFLTLSDRIKMGRRKLNNDHNILPQCDQTLDTIESKLITNSTSNTISLPDSDHDMYTKHNMDSRLMSSVEKPSTSKHRSKSYPPLPVKMRIIPNDKSQSLEQDPTTSQSDVPKSSEINMLSNETPKLNIVVPTSAIITGTTHQPIQSTSTSNNQLQLTPGKEIKFAPTTPNSSADTSLSSSEESANILMKNTHQSFASSLATNRGKQSQNTKEKAKESSSKSSRLSPLAASRPPLKRRHPVSKKGPSKKSSPTVFLKNTSADSESSAEEENEKTKQKRPRGRPPKSEIRSTPGDCDGYPNLWPRRKASFKTERQYNATVAKLPPHCAVCTLFCPYYKKCLNGDQKPPSFAELLEKSTSRPQVTRSKPLIPEINFATSINNPAPLATCQFLDSDGKSPLIQCQVCMVQVHASCYGVIKSDQTWTCDRCSFKAWIAQCSLCCLRGGALKPVNDGLQWAHILCAVSIPEVSFDDIPLRNGINIKKLSPARQKLKCTYCRRAKKNLQSLGTCIQCCAGICAISFHPTCAHAAGVKMETGDWPLPVFVYCHRHALQKERASDVKSGKILPNVVIGQTVFGKHRNGRYYPCVIQSETSQNFHHVIFSDNSWSDNLYLEDIISHTFESNNLKEGEKVSVKWTDGKIYDATYVQCKKHQVLMVEFEDRSFLSIKREDMYTSMDEMPSRIRRKLSNATLMRKSDYLESPKKLKNTESYVSQRAAFNEKRKKMATITSLKVDNDESRKLQTEANNTVSTDMPKLKDEDNR